MSIKELLSQKITTEDQLLKVIDSGYGAYSLLERTVRDPWWVTREKQRVVYGVYPAHSDVTARLAKALPWTGLHVSKEDAGQIAYTVDRANGEADRQIRTTLGRFLQKWYPAMPDDMLQNLVSEHTAEVSTELELLSGQAIVDFYMSGQLASCMTHGAEHWAGLDGHHPAEVYDRPNVYLAVVRDTEGKVNGRSLVWHVSETDKRFIRCYGTPALQKRLVRMGYKSGTWQGMKFKAIKLSPVDGQSSDQERYLMPYLDGANSAGNSDRSSIVLLDGDLLCVAPEQRRNLNMAGCVVHTCTNTSGYQLFTPASSEQFQQTCPLTGKTELKWGDDWVSAYVEGRVQQVLGEALITWKAVSNLGRVVYAPEDAPIFEVAQLDTPANREHRGYCKLSLEHYPEEQEYQRQYTLRQCDGLWFKEADLVSLITEEFGHRTRKRTHRKDIQPTWVRLANIDGEVAYTDHPEWVERTPSKAKVIPGYHDISRTWDGKVDFDRNVHTVQVWNRNYTVSRKANMEELKPKLQDEAFAEMLQSSQLEYEVVQALRSVQSYGMNATGNRRYVDYDTTYAECLAYAKALLGADHPAWEIYRRYETFKSEAAALDFNCPDVQGGAAGTWQAPAEVPDDFGLLHRDRVKVVGSLPSRKLFSKWFTMRETDFADKQDFCEAFAKVICTPLAGADSKYDSLLAWVAAQLADRYDNELSAQAAESEALLDQLGVAVEGPTLVTAVEAPPPAVQAN